MCFPNEYFFKVLNRLYIHVLCRVIYATIGYVIVWIQNDPANSLIAVVIPLDIGTNK